MEIVGVALAQARVTPTQGRRERAPTAIRGS